MTADIAIASFFLCRVRADPARWPRTARFVGEVLEHPAIASLLPFEDVQRSVAIKPRRQALLDAGAPLTATAFGLREPRKGVMRL